jgi:hypothetical protein
MVPPPPDRYVATQFAILLERLNHKAQLILVGNDREAKDIPMVDGAPFVNKVMDLYLSLRAEKAGLQEQLARMKGAREQSYQDRLDRFMCAVECSISPPTGGWKVENIRARAVKLLVESDRWCEELTP